jgi:hypothetical protein
MPVATNRKTEFIIVLTTFPVAERAREGGKIIWLKIKEWLC